MYKWLLVVLFVFGINVAQATDSVLLEAPRYNFDVMVGDGDSVKLGDVKVLQAWFDKTDCPVNVNVAPIPLSSQEKNAGFVFMVEPIVEGRVSTWPVVAAAITFGNKPLSTAWLVHQSTGIDQLSSLEGEWIALLEGESLLGSKAPLSSLKKSGVDIGHNKILYAKDFQGVIGLLLHRNVMAAAIPGPLAHRWAEANGLRVVFESAPLVNADIKVNPAVDRSAIKRCQPIFKKLVRENRRDKKMKVFPEWLHGFE